MIRSVAAVAIAGLLGVAFLPPRDAPTLSGTPGPTGAAQTAPRYLSWRPSDEADYYLVEMFAGETLRHAQSVRATSIEVPRWLPPGRYSWRVFAGTGLPDDRDLRRRIDSGWILVRDESG